MKNRASPGQKGFGVRKAIISLVRLAIFVIVMSSVCFGIFVVWARGKSTRDLGHNSIARVIVTTLRFLNSPRNRDARCTSREVWKLLYNFSDEEDMRAAVHLVRNQGEFSLVGPAFGEFWMPWRDVEAASEMFMDEKQGIYQSVATACVREMLCWTVVPTSACIRSTH